MLDVGFSEILLTSAIALIVLGPERLPKVARQVGNWMGRARAMARQLSEQLEREVNAEELLKTQTKLKPGAVSPGAAALNDAKAPNPGASIEPSIAPEPTYGRPASETTAAAMHASDPPADPNPTHE
jgi:Tat protein translocase TatB subunit